MRVAVLVLAGFCLCVWVWKFLYACFSVWVCVRLLHPSLPLSLQNASQKQRKQQTSVVDSNRAYKQPYKSSLQTSNFRFVLSHLHLTQVRQDTAVQPLTILAEEVTVALRLPVSKLSLCLSRSVVALFPTKENNKNRAHSFNQITLSLTTASLFKALFSAYQLFLYLPLLLQSPRSPWNQPFVP